MSKVTKLSSTFTRCVKLSASTVDSCLSLKEFLQYLIISEVFPTRPWKWRLNRTKREVSNMQGKGTRIWKNIGNENDQELNSHLHQERQLDMTCRVCVIEIVTIISFFEEHMILKMDETQHFIRFLCLVCVSFSFFININSYL